MLTDGTTTGGSCCLKHWYINSHYIIKVFFFCAIKKLKFKYLTFSVKRGNVKRSRRTSARSTTEGNTANWMGKDYVANIKIRSKSLYYRGAQIVGIQYRGAGRTKVPDMQLTEQSCASASQCGCRLKRRQLKGGFLSS